MKRRMTLVSLCVLFACAICLAFVPALGWAVEGDPVDAAEPSAVPSEEDTEEVSAGGDSNEATNEEESSEDEATADEEAGIASDEEAPSKEEENVAEEDEAVVSAEATNEATTRLANVKGATVTYRTHVQSIGWQDWKTNGTMAGTSGQAKRLEAIEIGARVPGVSGGITYRTHVQTYGWQGWKSNGETSGTSGESKRLEAIEIKLTGDLATKYDVWYRVHVQDIGWQDWKTNGAMAGTSGQAKRLEAIEVKLMRKGGASLEPVSGAMVNYNVHCQGYGWMGTSIDGELAGTTGESKRLEAINIKLGSQVSGGITYRTHVQGIGWQDWRSNGQTAGTSGQSKRLEAIQIKLTGDAATKYKVSYRVHVQSYGWQGWRSNGQTAGTTGESKRLEAIEILIQDKDEPSLESLIYIDAGHGKSGSSGYDPGSSGSGYVEADLTKELVNRIAYYARNDYGLNVYPNIDCNLPYTQRQAHAQSVGATSFLSIHFNWAGSGATGYESFIYRAYGQYTGKAATGSSQLQDIMHAHLKRALPGLYDRGKKSDAFAVVNGAKTGIPATLLEVCFISNANDMKYYQSRKELVAKELAAGLYEAYKAGF